MRILLLPLQITILFSGLAFSQSSEASFTFDPQKCHVPDPEGKAYVALRDTVFHISIDQLSILHDPVLRDGETLPLPPDPSEPLGCKGNPLSQQSLLFSRNFNGKLGDRPDWPKAWPLRKFQLFSSTPSHWGLHLDERHDKMCENRLKQTGLVPNMTACLFEKNPARPDRYDVEEAGSWLIDPEVYSAPFNKRLAIFCMFAISGGTDCEVGYKIFPTVNLSYEFNPKEFPLTEVINFDKYLRAELEQAVVKDYPWKKSPPN
ncbi:hypothetical protein [Pectobacterium brasiliense]|uniref:hypothetical protein n=1 Tax=Pectobacterium brasiliense TaxID=180957 RepID=UPI002A8029B3|nr:hypothetical protein [Pectobacterium brasiliense]MDY4347675.1 hypothetical protein [Pectobacterium brasiliense]